MSTAGPFNDSVMYGNTAGHDARLFSFGDEPIILNLAVEAGDPTWHSWLST